ncbi:MAG: FecR domain-containing protein, partial [Verrucomicrobiota bacterium]
MKLCFPSYEFDDAVAAVCHGSASDEQIRALNALLLADPAARDAYLFRVELHARLASDPDLFLATTAQSDDGGTPPGSIGEYAQNVIPLRALRHRRKRMFGWVVALAACVAVLAGGWWRTPWQSDRKGTTSRAVAMLNQVVDAQWSSKAPRLGAPLDPGWLQLKSGLAQVVFYSGARVAIEGPAEFQIISPSEASIRVGRVTAEVPPQARGFRIATPQINVTDLGTVFGLDVKKGATELHVFKGS